MKKIANIVSETDLVNHKKLDWINYSKTIEGCNLALPTLIIGWNNYREIYKYLYPNILEKRNPNNPNIRWEFSMTEKMVDYFNGIDEFVKVAPREYCNLFKYISIDPIKDGIETEEDLLKKIPNDCDFYYQYKDEIIYLLDTKTVNTIYGVYLNSFRYFKYDLNKITKLLQSCAKHKKNDSDGSIYQQFYKQFPEFDQLKRIMVVFCF